MDTEVYQNYFLVYFKEIDSNNKQYFELTPDAPLNTSLLSKIMSSYTIITFNGNSYDLPIIIAALEGWSNEAMFNLSKNIITSNKSSWTICEDNDISIPKDFDTIDLIEVAARESIA